MRKIPTWGEGGLFGLLIVPLVFLLKLFCPLSTGCFADPFLIPLFSPLFISENIFHIKSLSFWQEIIYITFFWTAVFSLLSYLFQNVIPSKEEIVEEDEDEFSSN
jgi:hypothetical protein